MKKTCILIIATLGNLLLMGQSEWAPEEAVWYYTFQDDFPPTPTTSVKQIQPIGDTTILGKACRLVESTRITMIEPEIMYSDSSKVYFYEPSDSTFRLLYDFTKVAGEHWDVPVGIKMYSNIDTMRVMVDSVTSSQGLDVQHVSIFSLSSGTLALWGKVYDNIGFESNMFYDESFWSGLTVDVYYVELRCYESNTTGLLKFIDGACDEITSLGEESNAGEEAPLILYPNPVKDYLNFQLINTAPLENGQFRIMDMNGSIVRSFKVDVQAADTYIVPVWEWPTGVYLLQYLDEQSNLLVSEKFIVTH